MAWEDLSSVNQSDARDAVRVYLRLGLCPIAVYGVTTDGACTCGRSDCSAAGKHPIGSGWQHRSVELQRLDDLLIRHPNANVGLRMGKQDASLALVCIDVDGERLLLEALEAELGELPPTLTARTGKGSHLIYRMPEALKSPGNRTKLAHGVDVRGMGGQIVAPPSMHRSGRRYRWENAREPDVLPAAWLAKLSANRIPRAPVAKAFEPGRAARYALAALASESDAVRSAELGGRNNQLNVSSLKIGQLVGGGGLDEELARSALHTAARAAGLSAPEAEATITSGLTAGRANPRVVPEPPGAPPTVDNSSAPRIEILNAEAIFAPLEPPDFLIEPVIVRGSVAELVAYGASGKTWIAVDAALSVGAAVPWLGRFRASRGNSLYLDWENGSYELRRRMHAVARGRSIETPVAGVSLACMPDLYMSAPDFGPRLERLADGCALIIIDTLRAATPGVDENDSRIRSGIDLLHRVGERTQCAFLVLAHAKKTSREEPVGLREAGRGSSAIFDAADTVLHVTYSEGEPLSVAHTKARSGHPVSPFVVQIADGDNGAVHVDASDGKQRADQFDELCDRVLVAVKANPGESTRVVRERVGSRHASVAAALDRLVHAGAVRNEGVGRADRWVPILRNGGGAT
jgi:hypothetical protein